MSAEEEAKQPEKKKTFSMFTKALIALFLAMVLFVIAWVPISRLLAARRVRNDLEAWAAKIKRYDNHFDKFSLRGVELQDPNNPFAKIVRFSVGTSDPSPLDKREEDPSRFYVTPPGKWVNDIDEVIRTWDEQYRIHLEQGLAPVRQ